MQKKKNNTRVTPLSRLFILTILWMLQGYVWAQNSPDTTEKQIIRQDQETQSSETTTDQQNPDEASVQKTIWPGIEASNKNVCLASSGKGPEMVIIPAGTFMMGSTRSEDEIPELKVTITRPFAIGRCEVTFADYALFTDATARNRPDDEGWGGDNRPVINVSWDDVQAYIHWLSQATGRRYRLPTEAEWEYAARAGTITEYHWNDKQDINNFAWYSKNSDLKTHPVGEKNANQFGLYDMAGNVWEWVQDCWHDNYDSAPKDGSSWEQADKGICGLRVLRGGSWYDIPWALRSADRANYRPDARDGVIGFRLAQDLN